MRNVTRVPWFFLIFSFLVYFISFGNVMAGDNVWSEVWPNATTNPVNTLALNPSNLNSVYVGTQQGGVFNSTNGGTSWTSLNTGLASDIIITSIVIDPTHNAIYAADFNSGNCVNKTVNEGSSWSHSSSGLTNGFCNVLAVDSTNNIVYVATFGGVNGGVFSSVDGGTTWTPIVTGLPDASSTERKYTSLVVLAGNILYAGLEGDGVYKTTNGGASWSAVNTGLTNTEVHSLIVDPSDSNVLYAGTNGGLCKTTNGGASWYAVNTGISNAEVFSLALDSTRGVIYAGICDGTGGVCNGAQGIESVYRSADGGSNWSAITNPNNDQAFFLARVLALNTTENILYGAGNNSLFSVVSTGSSSGGGGSSGSGGGSGGCALFENGDLSTQKACYFFLSLAMFFSFKILRKIHQA